MKLNFQIIRKNETRWIMGELKKVAIGNIDLGKLTKRNFKNQIKFIRKQKKYEFRFISGI